MNNNIKAAIVADSKNEFGNRITTFLVTFPRIILAELNTHRMLSKNSASSRAIPFEKMIKAVEENPFIPIAWQKDHKGMQGIEYIVNEEHIECCIDDWLDARTHAINKAKTLNQGFFPDTLKEDCVTKQLVNRLLEPFMYHTVLITGTEWENFFNLRCPAYQTPVSQTIEPQRSWKDLIENHSNEDNIKLLEDNKDNILFKLEHNKGQAEIHMMALAEAMWDCYNESVPKQLKEGEWHIPFHSQLDFNLIGDISHNRGDYKHLDLLAVKISTAMAARTSYTIVGNEKEFGYDKQIELHDRMAKQVPFHASPFEHCAKCMSDDEYNNNMLIENGVYTKGVSRNFRGFLQYRAILENK